MVARHISSFSSRLAEVKPLLLPIKDVSIKPQVTFSAYFEQDHFQYRLLLPAMLA